jgi:hypothetical protein
MSVDGNVYFASIYELEDLLPASANTTRAVLVLHLRDRVITSLTGVDWLKEYAEKLHEGKNRLMLSGVDDRQLAILERTGVIDLLGREAIVHRDPTIGVSTAAAMQEGERWIAEQSTGSTAEQLPAAGEERD